MAKTLIEENWEHLGIAIESVIGEPGDAYQGFLTYAFLQTNDRTLKKTSEMSGYSTETLRKWQDAYNWIERAKAIDATRFLIEFEKQTEQLAEANLSFVESNIKQKKELLGAGEKLLDVAHKMLDMFAKADQVIEDDWVETADGRWIPTTTTIKPSWKASDIPRFIETSLKIQRGVSDLPTEVVEPKVLDVKDKSLDEMKKEHEKLRKELNSIIQVDNSQ